MSAKESLNAVAIGGIPVDLISNDSIKHGSRHKSRFAFTISNSDEYQILASLKTVQSSTELMLILSSYQEINILISARYFKV